MFKFMTAAVLSTLIAVTPAVAQDSQRRQLNEGALAAILIGGATIWALSQSNKNKSQDRHRQVDDVYRHTHGGSTHWHHRDENKNHWHDHRRHGDGKFRKRVLPRSCIQSADNGNRDFRYVQTRCLRNENYTRRLPSSCGLFKRNDGTPRAYGVRCLKQAGYRFEARR